jgi:protein TonB
VDVVEKKAAAVAPTPQAKTPAPKAFVKAPPKAAPKVVTGDMPVKEPIAEPAPDDSKEALTQAQDDSLQKQGEEQTPENVDVPTAEEVAPPAPEPTPAPLAPVAEAPKTDGTDSSGSPNGVQSDTVLTPFGTNRPITYPMMARMRKLEGTALAHYTVDAQGNVTNVEIVQSSGSPSLDDQVVSTIKDWKFKPLGHEGVYERPVQFSLKGDAQAAPSRLRRGK